LPRRQREWQATSDQGLDELSGKPGAQTAAEMHDRYIAGANRMTALRLAALDLPEGNAMRAPGEAPGLMALEIAMDEMAEKLGIDPLEFRVLNDTQVDPERPERPFSKRQLVECARLGAERFGWDRRNPTPGATREGRQLIGYGLAIGFRNNLLIKSAARVRLDDRGVVTVETDMTDIGTGSYTIIAQTAAEMMGLPALSGNRILSFIERIERIDEEIKELSEGKKEVFNEAKGDGFDVKILKEILRLRKQGQHERDEQESLLDLYLRAMQSAVPGEAKAA
jgi:uncharacterized protein (UPF0335 family)